MAKKLSQNSCTGFGDKYAPVINNTKFWLVLAMFMLRQLQMAQVYVKSAFLHEYVQTDDS